MYPASTYFFPPIDSTIQPYINLIIYETNDLMKVLECLIAYTGSIIFTSFLMTIVLSKIDMSNLPQSHQRAQNIILDVLENQRGKIQTYACGLIQSYVRIKKYQKLCEFEHIPGRIRPSVKNKKEYKSNRGKLE
jgi:hypothetical protein